MLARIAVGLTRSGLPEHRWRQIVVPVAAAIALVLALAAASVFSLLGREAERDRHRTALLAGEPAPTDIFVVSTIDEWRGRQFSVVWIEPASAAAPALPPGISRLPAPGQAAVSPALDRLAAESPGLAARYPDRFVLGSDGIRTGGELLAYIRPPADRTIATDRRAIRASGFGAPPSTEGSLALGLDLPIERPPIAMGLVVFLVIPGLLLLGVSLATASTVRDRRFSILHRLGASRRSRTILAILEAGVLALPGLVLATVVWTVLTPRLTWVPLVGRDVVRADLALPWWMYLAAFGLGLGCVGGAAAGVTGYRERRGTAPPRPDSGRVVLTPLRLAPFGFAVSSFVAWKIIGGTTGATLFIVGIAVAMVAVPVFLPNLLRPVGAALARLRPVPALLAGRGLEWDPVHRARPFAGFGALLTLALAATGYFALLWQVPESTRADQTSPFVMASWLDPRPEDLARLSTAMGSGLVVPYVEDETTLLAGTTCSALASYVPDIVCDPGAPHAPPSSGVSSIAAFVLFPGADLRLADPSELPGDTGRALVFDHGAGVEIANRVQVAAAGVLPGLSVRVADQATTVLPSLLVPWLESGITLALLVLAGACIVAIVDRILATRGNRRLLLSLGLLPRQCAALEAWQFATSFGVVAIASTGIGLFVCAMIVGASSAVAPWSAVRLTIGLALFAGLVGTACVAVFGARSVSDHSRP